MACLCTVRKQSVTSGLLLMALSGAIATTELVTMVTTCFIADPAAAHRHILIHINAGSIMVLRHSLKCGLMICFGFTSSQPAKLIPLRCVMTRVSTFRQYDFSLVANHSISHLLIDPNSENTMVLPT
ncbi:unnamed protein product [Arctogadus glacialis]